MAVPSAADWIAGLESGRVTWGRDWHEIAPRVFCPSLPLRLDGVFWGVTARTLDAIAVAWSPLAGLLTPLVADLIRDQAAVRLEFEQDPSAPTAAMKEGAAMRRYSAALDRRLRERGVDPDGAAPLCCLGIKDWAITRALELRRLPWNGAPIAADKACNYGAYSASADSPSVSGRWRVIQSPGYVHNLDHLDYSQLARLVFIEPGSASTVPSHDGASSRHLPPPPGGGELAALAGILALGLGFG